MNRNHQPLTINNVRGCALVCGDVLVMDLDFDFDFL
jgi:hypothetical protein